MRLSQEKVLETRIASALAKGERSSASRLDEVMPRVSSFYGIVITMYFGDHAPPYFHARHGGDEAKIGIEDGALLSGSLSRRDLSLVREWLGQHRPELRLNWQRVVENRQPEQIEPLR